MESKKPEGVYKTSREIKISILSEELVSTLLDDIIIERVADIVSEEHDGNGIVIPETVKIVSRTPLYQDLTKFDGSYACHVRYIADCYDAPKGMKTTAIVRVTLPNGVLCETEMPNMKHPVYRVFLPYEVHNDSVREIMRSLIRDQVIRFRSIQRYGGLGDTTIDVLGEFQEIIGDTPLTQRQISGKIRDKTALTPDDFRQPSGPDAHHLGALQEFNAGLVEDDGDGGDAGLKPTSKSSSSQPIVIPTLDETSLYSSWVDHKVSLTNKTDSEHKEKTLIAGLSALVNKYKLWYDPTNRRFTGFIDGIDVFPEHSHYLYRPLPSDNIGSTRYRYEDMVEPLNYTPVSTYEMVITNNDAKTNPSTANVLQKYLPRRLYGVVPKTVYVLSLYEHTTIGFNTLNITKVSSLSPTKSDVEKQSHEIIPTNHKLVVNGQVGNQIESIIQTLQMSKTPPDLIVLDTRIRGGEEESKTSDEEEEDKIPDEVDMTLDPFIPTYPVIVDKEVLIFTPAQAVQCMYAFKKADTVQNVITQFLNCASVELGAHIQRPSGSDGFVRISSIKPNPVIETINPALYTSIPTIEHGWMSLDTHAALIGTLNAVNPNTIFELGSWYGLSTRTMLSVINDANIYSFDKFKAPPFLSYNKHKIGVEDNFFFNHPRHDTFAANISTSLRGLGTPVFDDTASAAAAAPSLIPETSNHVHILKGDISELLEHMKKTREDLVPDVIFVDFEKRTDKLVSMLKALQTSYPKCVIVGDDYVFRSVKRALANFHKTQVIAFDESYVLLPKGIDKDIKTNIVKSIQDTREQLLAIDESLKPMIDKIAKNDIRGVLGIADSVNTIIPHTQAQMALHEVIRKTRYLKSKDYKTKRREPVSLSAEVIEALKTESVNWKSGSVNFAGLTPWDYASHKLSFFGGE
jgi:hypothetical protein